MARPPNGIRSLPILWRVLGLQHGFASRTHHKQKGKWKEVLVLSNRAFGLVFALPILIISMIRPGSGVIGSTRRFIERRSKFRWMCGWKNSWLLCPKTLLGNVLAQKNGK